MTTTTPPSVDRLLRSPSFRRLVERFGRDAVLEALRELLAGERARFRAGDGGRRPERWYEDRCLELIERFTRPSMRPVFNLTGTVVHTNLGRALLPRAAVDALVDAALEPTNLEFDVDRGRRGERDDHVEALLCALTGAEAATVVNNNAAAVLLALNTLALRREVLVSRGELIEIGGSFRMPRIMARAGCRLHEVGTTNRTHLDDFREAIGARTALVMKVHASNYEIRGFTAAADEKALAALAREHGVPFVVDLGSGSLVDLGRLGLAPEPTPMQALANGAGLVTFSGDKLLGGPQAGIVVGERALVERLDRNPLKRALRLDKLRMAALAAVLRLHRDPDRLARELPTLRLLTRPLDAIEALGHRLLPAVRERLGPDFQVSVEPCESQIGSGALPGKTIPSAALAIRPPGRRRTRRGAVQRIAAALRALPIPVIGRIHDDALLLDLRCLEDEDRFLAQLPLLALTGDGDAGVESRS